MQPGGKQLSLAKVIPQSGLIIEGLLPAALLVAGRISPSFLRGMVHHSIHPRMSVCSHSCEHLWNICKTPNPVIMLNRCSFVHSSSHPFIIFFPEVTGENQLVISLTSKKGIPI